MQDLSALYLLSSKHASHKMFYSSWLEWSGMIRKRHVDRVWKAIKSGARTSREIEAITGIPVNRCNSSLWWLRMSGLVRIAGKLKSHNGSPLNVYEVIR